METPKHFESEGDINLNPMRQAWIKSNIDSTGREWLEKDSDYFIHQSLSTPCLNVIEKCEGIYLIDTLGRKYMDFHGNSVHQLGYRNPYIIEKVMDQMNVLPFSPRRYTNIPAIQAAEKLATLCPENLKKVLFTTGGASSVGLALKITRVATGRYKTISMWNSFHGASLDVASVGGESLFRKNIGPLMPGGEHVPFPDKYRGIFTTDGPFWDEKYAEYLEYILAQEGDVAAVIAEPVRCTTVNIPTTEFWKRVQAACDKHGTLLIFDEVPTFLGRTGKMFSFENIEVVPDILVLGKALGGGFIPFSAVVVNNNLNIPPDTSLGHYTFEKSPLGAAAALASFEYYEKHNIESRVKHLEFFMRQRLGNLYHRYPIIGDVRGIGLLWGVELVTDRSTREPANEAAAKVVYSCLQKGLSFKVSQGNILTLTPPLIINDNELIEALEILETIIKYL